MKPLYWRLALTAAILAMIGISAPMLRFLASAIELTLDKFSGSSITLTSALPILVSNILTLICFPILLVGLIRMLIKRQAIPGRLVRIVIYYFLFSVVMYYATYIFTSTRVSMFGDFSTMAFFIKPWIAVIVAIMGALLYITQKTNLRTIDNFEASNVRRFFNFLVDVIVISSVSMVLSRFAVVMMDVNIDFYISYLITSFFYYLLLESIFRETVGKAVTSTVVVVDERTNFKSILLRTVCRFIPFEPISFFFENGKWHDRFSNTGVRRVK